jgi:hypothetical protein
MRIERLRRGPTSEPRGAVNEHRRGRRRSGEEAAFPSLGAPRTRS